MKNHSITYQRLEEKYLESAIDCIVKTKMRAKSFEGDLGYTEEMIYQDFKTAFQDPSIFKSTIIAVDQSKHNYVCGIFPGQDFCEYYKSLKRHSKHDIQNIQNQIVLKLYEPIIAKNYNPGEFIVGIGLGVREEYGNQYIAQELTKLFFKNAFELNYIVGGSDFYNKASTHIAQKHNGYIISYLDLQKTPILPNEYKKKLNNSQIILLYYILNKNIPQTKIISEALVPKL